MNINTYLEQLQNDEILQEIDFKSLINMPKETIQKKLIDIKGALKSKNFNKLKTIIKLNPKIEFEKVEKFAKNKIEGFKNLQVTAEKVLINSIKGNKKEIKMISSLIAITSSVDKNPKAKLKELLKKTISESKNNEIPLIHIILMVLGIWTISVGGTVAGISAIPVIIFIIIFSIIVNIISYYLLYGELLPLPKK